MRRAHRTTTRLFSFAPALIPILAGAPALAQVIGDLAEAPAFVEPGVEVLYYSWGSNPNEQYGYVTETIADLTGDGVPEILNSAPFRAIDGNPRTGAAFVHDGRTGAVIATHEGNHPAGFFGWRLGALGDVNGDGVRDYAIGAAGDIFRTNPTVPGQAFIYSGADHTLIRQLDAAEYATTDTSLGNDRFGQDISTIGDLDADGLDDFIVTADLWDEDAENAGRAWILSAADFSVIRTHTGEAPGDRFGSCTNPIGDANGDGVPEYLIAARNGGPNNKGIAHIYDGATGGRLFSVAGDSDTMQNFGQYFASSPGDCTGDGIPDIFVSDFTDSAAGQWTGAAYLFDTAQGIHSPGETITPYWRVIGTERFQSVGFGGGAGDVDDDGCADIAICFLADQSAPDHRWAGRVRIYSGKTGKVLRTISSTEGNGPSTSNWGEQFGYSISHAGDSTGDGVPDLVVTAGFGRDDTGVIVGRYYGIAGARPCTADYDGDLDADFQDIVEYFVLFGGSSPAADIAEPLGAINFFDVSAYIAAYNEGCL